MKQIISAFGRRSALAPWVVVWCLVLASAGAAQAPGGSCFHPDQPDFYSKKKYRVKNVSIKSPFGIVARSLAPIKQEQGFPIKQGDVFTLEDANEGRKRIETRLEAMDKSVASVLKNLRMKVVFTKIDNCHESDPLELDIIYWIITTDYNFYLSHTWEFKEDETLRPASAISTAAEEAGSSQSIVRVDHYAGYNRSQQLFGGGQARLRMSGRLFQSVDFNASGSPAGSVVSLGLTGARAPERTTLSRLEYRLNYQHVDLPADNNRLRQGILQFQIFGATKPFGAHNLVVRFGAALEGGNQQTDLVREAAAVQSEASSGYGALKSYIGATLRAQNYALAGSYGVQFGTLGATAAVDFIKHVGDLTFSASWFPGHQKTGEVHKPLTLEAQLSGGAIQRLGRIPVTERYFGGNAQQSFISGDAWRIQNGPFIRSIPQNRFGGAVGGTSFYSLNLTATRPVWGYPMIPKEMAKDPEFPDAWNGAQDIAESLLRGEYLNKFPEAFAEIIAHTSPLRVAMDELKILLNSLPEDPPDELPSVQRGQYTRILRHVKNARALTGLALRDEERNTLPSKLERLILEKDRATCMGPPLPLPPEDEAEHEEDDSSLNQITCSKLTQLHFELGDLAGLLRQSNLIAESDQMIAVQLKLMSLQSKLVEEFKLVDKSRADQMAASDMKAVRPVLKAIKDEINLFAISPVAIFDAARIWPDSAGTCFGLGGGVRVTVVNFNLTLGYAFNPAPRPREGRGALFFSMDVTDIFH